MSMIQSGLHDVMSKLDDVGTTFQSAVFTLFKKDLHDLVSGIRASKGNESKYINDAVQEIKEELKSLDHDVKAVAILKLTYLQMLGYNMDWAAFRVIEVIARADYAQKRVGYLAATQSFSEGTDVILLITNMIRKDLLSPNMYDGGIALNCLANICTTELARDLVPDIVSMLSSARPYIRKKAVLVMFKIFLKFPDALRPSFPRLKEKLDDPDVAVVCAAVNVICELAKKNAKNYLPLAPTLFKILTKSTNNWMLIKVIKLFAVLIPLEERLGKKLVEPLCNIINSTNSMSLMYEAIYTCIVGLSSYKNVMQLCSSKLRMFIEHPDQNLKYLGLLALSKIMEVFPKGIMEHRDLILNCLEDEDQTIRLRAVELLTGMVDRKNLVFIVDKLRHYLDTADGPYRDELLEKIIYICSQEKYKFVSDFEWYIGVLIDLTHVKGVKNGSIVSSQILDVSVRVKVVRPSVVKHMILLLQDKVLVTEDANVGSMCEALYAAAWVVGEYADLCEEHLVALDTLTHNDAIGLPAHIQSIYIQNALKVFAVMTYLLKNLTNPSDESNGVDSDAINRLKDEIDEAIKLLKSRLPSFTSSQHIEVQERATFLEQLITLYEEQIALGVNIGEELAIISQDALNPVSAQAQSRVPKPDDLDLDAWINDPIPDEDDDMLTKKPTWEEEPESDKMVSYGGFSNEISGQTSSSYFPNTVREVSAAEIKKTTDQIRSFQKSSPYYISDPVPQSAPPLRSFEQDFPKEAAMLRGEMPSGAQPALPGRGPSGRGRRPRGARIPAQEVTIVTEEENPEGWQETAQPARPVPTTHSNDALSNIDLTKEAEGEVALPTRKHRTELEPAVKPEPIVKKPPVPGAKPRGRGTAGAGRTGQRTPAAAGAPGGRTARGRGRATRGRGRTGRTGRGRVPPSSTTTTNSENNVAEVVHPKATQDEANPSPSPTTATKKAPPKKRPVCVQTPLASNDDVELSYELAASKAQKNRLLGVFYIKNVLSVPIEKAHFTFATGLSIQVAPHPKRAPTDPIPVETIDAGALLAFKLPFQFEAFVSAQNLPGSFSFAEKTIEFQVHFPVSSVFLPSPIEQAQFLHLVKNTATCVKTTSLQTSLDAAVNKIQATYKLSVIEKTDEKVSLYGQTVQEHHAAFLLKVDGERLAVMLKSNNEQLLESIHSELNSLSW